jgi:hypothetical protein
MISPALLFLAIAKPSFAATAWALYRPQALRKTGRPRLEDRASTLTATKPWEAAGMSRTTWFRRQKENPDSPPRPDMVYPSTVVVDEQIAEFK